MPTLTVRNVDAETHAFLRQQAAAHGRSMEAEVRALLAAHRQRAVVRPGRVADAIRARFEGAGPLPEMERVPMPAPPFGE